MKVEIKCLEGTKWNHLPVEKIKGHSIIDFMMDELSPTVAAVYDEEDKVLFCLSNTEQHKQLMKDNGKTCFSVSDMQILLGSEEVKLPSLVAHTFPGSHVMDIRRIEVQESFT